MESLTNQIILNLVFIPLIALLFNLLKSFLVGENCSHLSLMINFAVTVSLVDDDSILDSDYIYMVMPLFTYVCVGPLVGM